MRHVIDPEIIRHSNLGRDLDDEEARTLTEVMECRQLSDGQILVEEGDADATLYLLAQGVLRVVSSAQGKPEIVHTMSVGECAGTRAFVDRAPRRATITARGPAVVYGLMPDRLEKLLDSHPGIVYKAMRGVFRATHANLDRIYRQAEQLTNYVTKTHGRY